MPEPEHPNAADDALAERPALLAANQAALTYLRAHLEQLLDSYCSWTTGGDPIRPASDAAEEAHLREVEQLIQHLALLPPPAALEPVWPVSGILDMSTAHICTEARDLIDKWAEIDRRASRSETVAATPTFGGAFGWIIKVPAPEDFDCDDVLHGDSIPASLLACLDKARGLGCAYIRFDADGQPHDDLPAYDW